jgi:hypothetical protein
VVETACPSLLRALRGDCSDRVVLSMVSGLHAEDYFYDKRSGKLVASQIFDDGKGGRVRQVGNTECGGGSTCVICGHTTSELQRCAGPRSHVVRR